MIVYSTLYLPVLHSNFLMTVSRCCNTCKFLSLPGLIRKIMPGFGSRTPQYKMEKSRRGKPLAIKFQACDGVRFEKT